MSCMYESVGLSRCVSVAAVPPLDATAKAMSVEDTPVTEGRIHVFHLTLCAEHQ